MALFSCQWWERGREWVRFCTQNKPSMLAGPGARISYLLDFNKSSNTAGNVERKVVGFLGRRWRQWYAVSCGQLCVHISSECGKIDAWKVASYHDFKSTTTIWADKHNDMSLFSGNLVPIKSISITNIVCATTTLAVMWWMFSHWYISDLILTY